MFINYNRNYGFTTKIFLHATVFNETDESRKFFFYSCRLISLHENYTCVRETWGFCTEDLGIVDIYVATTLLACRRPEEKSRIDGPRVIK